MIRGDLSNRLIHLTRGASTDDAAGAFQSIVGQGALLGSNGYIRGGYNCVCFSEAPIGVLAQVLARPRDDGMRYAPFGVMVSKQWLFEQGGRPVIYQAHEEFELLHEEQRYRHVRYEPTRGVDHTWEREWRVRTDRLVLHPEDTTFVVPTRLWERRFFQAHADDMAALNYNYQYGIIEAPPWHFIALEDLGVQFVDDA